MDIQNGSVIASRHLKFISDKGLEKYFDLKIFEPILNGPNDYCCKIYSDDIIFKGYKNAHGIDAIDAIDSAIQILDTFIDIFRDGFIIWPDGSKYNRTKTNEKMDWSIM